MEFACALCTEEEGGGAVVVAGGREAALAHAMEKHNFHRRRNPNRTDFKCPNCKLTFQLRANLLLHQSVEHPNIADDALAGEGEERRGDASPRKRHQISSIYGSCLQDSLDQFFSFSMDTSQFSCLECDWRGKELDDLPKHANNCKRLQTPRTEGELLALAIFQRQVDRYKHSSQNANGNGLKHKDDEYHLASAIVAMETGTEMNPALAARLQTLAGRVYNLVERFGLTEQDLDEAEAGGGGVF